MNKLIKKLEDIMVAVTFAESGEYDEAMNQSGDVKTDEEYLGFESAPLEKARK